jgi:hypothetical protein
MALAGILKAAHRCMSARTPAKSCSICTTHWSDGRANGGAGGMSPAAEGAHCVRRASYERGSMLDVTVAGSCAASCLRSAVGVAP